MLLAMCGRAWGQDTLALSSAAATAGGTVTLNLTLNAPATPLPAGLQWTITYSTVDFASINVAAGPAATAAAKSVSCNPGSGSYNCLLFGLNENTMSSGLVATVTLTVSSSTTNTSSAVKITNPSATDATGNLIAVTASGGIVSISQPYTLTALSCSPNPLTTPGTVSCSVTASAPAASGGLPVALGTAGSAASVSLPASVTIAQGATSASFSATANAVSATTTVTLVASLNGTSQSFSLQLVPPPPPPPAAPPMVTSLACSPTTLGSNASGVCKVTLSAAAPSSGATVSIGLGSQAPLTVPTSVMVPGGSTGASFSVVTGGISSNQTVTLTSSLNGSSVSCSLSLTASTTTKHHHH